MKKLTFYNENDIETELSFFINQKSEISFFIDDSSQPPSSISLSVDDVENIVNELQLLINYLKYERPN